MNPLKPGCPASISSLFLSAVKCASILAALLLIPNLALGQGASSQVLTTPSVVGANNFGDAVAVSGDTMVVGEPTVTVNGNTGQGRVHVYRWLGTGQWTLQQTLTAADGGVNQSFGVAVAVYGDTIAVGAYVDETQINSGAVYIFTRGISGWTQQSRLRPPLADIQQSLLFGGSVSLHENSLAIGAEGFDGTGSNGGKAYVFTRTNSATSFTLQSSIVPSDPEIVASFGAHVAIDGNTLACGAHLDDTTSTNQGAVYVFSRTGSSWSQQQKIVPADTQPFDWFGYSVALAGDYLTIGSINDDTGAFTNCGSVYVFFRTGTTWAQQAKLAPTAGIANNQNFGVSVSMSTNRLVVGVPQRGGQGELHIYARAATTWSLEEVIPGAIPGQFGYQVSMANDTVITGKPGQNTASIFHRTTSGGWAGGPVATPPVNQQPASIVSCVGSTAQFVTQSLGLTSTVFRWQRETTFGSNVWVDMNDGFFPSTSSVVTGSHTRAMLIENLAAISPVRFRCRIFSSGGNATTNAATLTVASAPIITSGLNDNEICRNPAPLGAEFILDAIGSAPLTYTWQIEDAPVGSNIWSNMPLGNVTRGATVIGFVFSNFPRSIGFTNYPANRDDLRFRCIVSNSCGSVISNPATLFICDADFDCDTSLTFFDYLDFVDAFSSGLSTADINLDGSVDFFDYLDFVDYFSLGC